MKVWAVANLKGGVAKTTSTISLAGLLADKGYKTLVIDLDPHASLSTYLGYEEDKVDSSVYTLFDEPDTSPEICIYRSYHDFLDVMPSNAALATLDRQLGSRKGKGLVISNLIKILGESYDYVLLDCPPVLGVLLVNALAACNYLLVPVQTDYLAAKGLDKMVGTVNMMNNARMDPIPYTIVPTMYDKRTKASARTIDLLSTDHGKVLWNGLIPIDTQFREASQVGQAISHFNSGTRGSIAYSQLLDFVCLKTVGKSSSEERVA